MTALTETERLKLGDLEIVIADGIQTFVQVGAALAQIREQRLYRAKHGTFEAYCQDRWGWTRQRASQLIGASEVVGSLSTIVDTPPTNEGQARELARVPEEERADVWQDAVETAEAEGRKPTAEHVRRAAQPARPGASRPSIRDESAEVVKRAKEEQDASAQGMLLSYVAGLPPRPRMSDEQITQGLAAGAFHSLGNEVRMLEAHRDLMDRIIAQARKGGLRVIG